MSEEQNLFMKNLQNFIWKVFGGLILVVILAVVPFYFNTTNELNHTKEQLKILQTSKADKAIYELTVKQIQKELEDLNSKLDKD